MTTPAILIVSNGHGEDAVGAMLAARMAPFADVTALPLVGTGAAYGDLPLLEPRVDLPSGGFGARGRGWLSDVRAGAIRHMLAQRRTLRGQARRVRVAVAIGDVFCLWMASAARVPVILVATAKSSRHDPFGRLEIRLLRSLAARTYARDEDTAAALRSRGVDAAYVGNPLMDAIGTASSPSRRFPDHRVVVLLPGSRAEAYRNLAALLRLADAVDARASVQWVCALAPTLTPDAVAASLTGTGWSALNHSLPSGSGQAAGTIMSHGDTRVEFTTDFAGAVREADVVVSLAGTASEQAAGLGKPVVAFPGDGPQFTARFLAAQQRLLGEALVATSGWTEAAAVVLRLLGDPDERLRRGAAGRQRMGRPGAIVRIAAEILANLKGAAR